MSLTDARARLKAHFARAASDETDVSTHNNAKWSELWDRGDFLPWDRGAPNPALVDLLRLLNASSSSRDDFVGSSCFVLDDDGDGNAEEGVTAGKVRRKRKRALVPGCGRGYDVLLLAGFGYDAFGLEVSEGALRGCEGEGEKGEKGTGEGEVRFLRGDFFRGEGEWVGVGWDGDGGGGGFDLIYDYTFLSALPPSLRPRWALRMAQLLAPKGSLICVEFPSAKDPLLGGPPFALPPQVYTEHLAHPGKEIPYDEKGHVKEGVSGPKSPDALTRVAHWRPERTHEIGKGQDWVSIWRH